MWNKYILNLQFVKKKFDSMDAIENLRMGILWIRTLNKMLDNMNAVNNRKMSIL